MAALTLRSTKGSILSIAELDANFTNLNTESGQKASTANPTFTGSVNFADPSSIAATTLEYPSRSPSLNLDFVNSGVLDSRVTFTRASRATRTNPQGLLETVVTGVPRFDYDPVTKACKGLLIEEQRVNLLEYANTPSSDVTPFSALLGNFSRTVSSIKAPDGTLTAATFTNINNITLFLRAVPTSITAGVTYTVSCYVWVPTQSGVTSWAINWDLADTENATSATQTTFDSWVRVTANLTPAATRSFLDFNIRFNGVAPTTAGQLFHVWGIQLEAGAFVSSFIPSVITYTGRASTATYIDSTGTIQTAASNVPRYQYNLTDLTAAPILLLEGAATNLLLQSAFTTTWTILNTALTESAILAPNGVVEADKLTETAINGEHYIRQIKTGLTAGETYTFSVYVKAAERNAVTLRIIDNVTYSNVLVLNINSISAGTIFNAYGIGTATYIKSSITAMPNSWFRISLTGIASSTATGVLVIINVQDAALTSSYLGVASSGIYIWGAQLETGLNPTSYIPTTTATVTRAADTSTSGATTRAAESASITGTNFSNWYNAIEGTIVAQASVPVPAAYTGYVYLLGTFNDGVMFYRQSDNQAVARVRSSSADSFTNGFGATWTTFAVNKNALTYKTSDFASSNNTGTVSSSSSGAVPSISTLALGSSQGTSGFLNGYLQRFTYYPQRLSNTVLQTLTT